MIKNKNEEFDLVNLPEACKDSDIKQEDFVLSQADKSIHEQKFQTKPTTFFKDSMRRFAKNKSSVVAAYILGFLVLLSIVVPIVSPYDVTGASDPALYDLEPKLFNSGTGFWDGTVKKKHIPVDTSSSDNPEDWMPDPVTYRKDGITEKVIEPEQYTNEANSYGRGGYAQFGFYSTYGLDHADIYTPNASDFGASLDLNNVTLKLVKFDTVDEEKIVEYQRLDSSAPILPEEVIPEGFELGNISLEFVCNVGDKEYVIPLTESKVVHNIGALPISVDNSIDIGKIIKDSLTEQGVMSIPTLTSFNFNLKVEENSEDEASFCSLIKSLVITVSDSADQATKEYFGGKTIGETFIPGISFEDATELLCRNTEVAIGLTKYRVPGLWSVNDLTRYVNQVYLSRCTFASFTYDGYKGALGRRDILLSSDSLQVYYENGWLEYTIDIIDDAGEYVVDSDTFYCEILSAACPLVEEFSIDDISVSQTPGPDGSFIYSISTEVYYYKYLGYSEMPSFLFGTDKSGKDMFKYVFEGLRNSLLLGVLTFVICFLLGLVWGSISGYFGGTADLIMERITDILSGLPWIVVMTLVVLKANESSFWTLALALCLTGWIGTASLTRTQFYRFRGREYVLASRTLGASHGRLIAKHILPNAMGTIITSSVLMIPAIIFQEATISYLGLGFKNLSSLGVILSNNQNQLTNHPYQLIFPSVVIALVMISFNLFGNGLRDAINPSLKGEDQ